jgi:hypothetical protein
MDLSGGAKVTGVDVLAVSWRVQLGHGEPEAREEMTVESSEDVRQLVLKLSKPGVDDAYVTHLGRPVEVVPGLGDEPLPDHVVHLAVRRPWGYITFAGDAVAYPEGFTGHPLGDAASPATHGSYNTDYAAGSGLPLDVFEQVVAEFLVTKELPTCVEWVSE